MSMHGHRYRGYPTPTQAQTLLRWIGCQRFIYNAKVREDRYFRTFARKALALAGQHAPIDQQYSHFKTELTPWLNDVPSQVLRNGAKRWKDAYGRFFKKLARRPTLHGNGGVQSVWLTSELFRFEEERMARKARQRKRWQRRMARRSKGSSGWRKAKKRVAMTY